MHNVTPATWQRITALLGPPERYRHGYEVDNTIRGEVIIQGNNEPYQQFALITYYAVIRQKSGRLYWDVKIMRVL